uniref:SOSEKI DIX-like domain-containing protein n=1 Tax=Kalanchoe fedtschenkoi TaxID=63787 RepID=A0A7N0U199_KALFE
MKGKLEAASECDQPKPLTNSTKTMESKMSYYYYYNGSSSTMLIKDQMTPLRIKQQPHGSSHSQPKMKPLMRKVQVVYYLSRNGQLEHPHFMEVVLSAPNLQHLRLKDVLERLTALRGRDMPALYSWSCKRSYKHGYVWNDLAENDVIYPTEGYDEYVLKGSELVQGCTDKLEALQLSKPTASGAKQSSGRVLTLTRNALPRADAEKIEDEEEEEEDENSSYSFSTNTPPSRCSVGISTDDIHLIPTTREVSVSPPPVSTSSSDSKVIEPAIQPGRNSVLLQLIACGSSTIGLSTKCGQRPKQITLKEDTAAGFLNQVIKCHSPVAKAADQDDEGVVMIECMSENPRFGGFQAKNKEYFSGSIVEAMAAAEERVAGTPSGLKRSNSFTEERSKKQTILEEQISEEVRNERQKMMTGKCIPRLKKPAAASNLKF